MMNQDESIPDAPCMEYLPTFGPNWWSMLVDILYMDHMEIGV